MSHRIAVTDTVATVLRTDRVLPDDTLAGLGGSSVQALRIGARLTRRLGVPIDAEPLLTGATVGEFTAAVVAAAGTAGTAGTGTLHGAVAHQARLRPDAAALRHAGRTVSYAHLDAAADTYAAALRRLGVGPGHRVPVLLPRTPVLAAVLLAVLKCGAAYSGVDHRWPTERVRTVVRALDAPLMVTGVPGADYGAPTWQPPAGGIEAAAAARTAPSGEPVAPGAAATVFFTSGTTGTPKGVVSPHRATLRLFDGETFADFGPGRVAVQAAPVAWDAFSLELWGMLTTGGTTVFAEGDHLFPDTLRDLARTAGADTVWLTASLFNLFVDENPDCFTGLRQVLIGGERLSVPHVRAFTERHPLTVLMNGYGPVESCVFASTRRIRPADCDLPDGIPVGTPVPGTAVHLLDGTEPVADGEPGEICVAGEGLALGYLGDAAGGDRFATVPCDGDPTPVYRTGDLARRDADGVLHYLGRGDRQVKIAGYRVEPTEIEAVARRDPGVRDCAVVPVHAPDGSCERLALFWTPAPGALGPATLHDTLAGVLPHYMVPATVRRTEALPLTANGKLDRAALLASLDRHLG